MGRLQARLDRIKQGFVEKTPNEVQAVMSRATAQLRESGIMERLPSVGTTLPTFALPDVDGNEVRSDDLLAQGPLVLTIYRGGW